MPNALCLLNHSLTDLQVEDLKNHWDCRSVIYPPEEISRFWSQIPESDITEDLLEPVLDWLDKCARQNDIVIIQGEFGATFALVSRCLEQGLVPVHSVTRRVAEERKEGEAVYRASVFKHIRFRKYRKIE